MKFSLIFHKYLLSECSLVSALHQQTDNITKQNLNNDPIRLSMRSWRNVGFGFEIVDKVLGIEIIIKARFDFREQNFSSDGI